MASADGVLGSSPLKAPAVEVVDLLSDDESVNELVPEELIGAEDDEDDQWSLYEDALAEMDDEDPGDNCMQEQLL